MNPSYVYKAICERVIDGDTYALRIDLGFRCAVSIEARLHGLDTDERFTPRGKLATAFATTVLQPDGVPAPLVVQTYRDERSFARWVCDIWIGDDLLADLLRDAGHER